MKKIVSSILTFVLVLSVAVMPAFAETTETEWLYKEKFIEYELQDYQELLCYEEQHYHKDVNGNIDWVFIKAFTNVFEEMPVNRIVADVYIYLDSRCTPFDVGYCIYDVAKDKFLGIGCYEDYDGMAEYIFDNIGVPIGDADMDGALTILDATYIQQAIAKLCEFNKRDDLREYLFVGVDYISDFDRDGERTILDATAIQLKLAGLSE